jgi:hypothetical protein
MFELGSAESMLPSDIRLVEIAGGMSGGITYIAQVKIKQ